MDECSNFPDREGAQLRNPNMVSESVNFTEGQNVEVHFESVIDNSYNISFAPASIARQFSIGDEITVDFHNVCLRNIEIGSHSATAIVVGCGVVGCNKASDVNRDIYLIHFHRKTKQLSRLVAKKELNTLPFLSLTSVRLLKRCAKFAHLRW